MTDKMAEGDSVTAGGYDPRFFGELAAVEDRHFWFRARNRLISAIVDGIAAELRPGYRVLEVGCGTGNVLRVLNSACGGGMVVGLERWYEGLLLARRRGAGRVVQGDALACPFSARFELIGLFDVLEHIPEEDEMLRALYGMTAPGGYVVMTVPAHPSLWSYFDEASHHCRRYAPGELTRKLAAAGFVVEFETQFMALLLPLVRVLRGVRANRRSGVSAVEVKRLADREFRIIPLLNGILTFFLGFEARWVGGRRRLPFGTSTLVIARKKGVAEVF
jgi:SAM-dependent methyltransferase